VDVGSGACVVGNAVVAAMIAELVGVDGSGTTVGVSGVGGEVAGVVSAVAVCAAAVTVVAMMLVVLMI
jgi:hypothetical protein